jgi:hemoglobin/transferrin/lactoferrin receptor protein
MKKILMLHACICMYMSVMAQEKKNPIADSLNEVSLNEITVSVTKFGENKKYLAQQVQTISAKKIALISPPTTAELLAQTGNVFIQKSQLGGGSPVIRGFEANKVLIAVDGVRMNNAIFRGGHLQNVITMDNSILDKVEIIFGPSSVIYGSDALGGVLSFYTKKPILKRADKDTLAANAYVRYASAYQEKTGHVDFNIGGKKLASLTSFTFSDFGDLQQGSNYYQDFPDWGKRSFYVKRINGTDSMIKNPDQEKQVLSGYSQFDVLQKVLLKTGKIEHVFNFQYSTSSDINRYDRLTETNNAGIARHAQWYYGPQKRLMAAYHMNLQAGYFYDKAQITLAYQDIEESRHNRNFKSTKLNHRIENIKVGSFNADFFKKIKKTEVSYGAEITHNKVNSSAYAENILTGIKSDLDTRYPNGGSNTQSYAMYVTSLHKFSEYFITNAGVRFTQNKLSSRFVDKTFFPFPFDEIKQEAAAISGNLGLVFLPGSNWKISGLIASGFRTPNVDDISKVFESGNGTLIVPNPDIRSEKTINYEISINKIIHQKWQIGTTLWRTNYSNALTTDFSSFNGSSTIIYNGVTSNVVTLVNKNRAFIQGVSANIGAELSKQFSFSSVINYSYGRIKETPKNYPLDHVPPVYGKTNVTGKFNKLIIELFALYNGEKDSSDYNLRGEDNQQYSADIIRGYTPSWFTANLRVAYEITKCSSVQLGIENAFDKFYRVFASGIGAPGRNFVITLRGRI